MLTQIIDLQRELTARINIISRDPNQAPVKKEEKSIQYINSTLRKLKGIIKNYHFEDSSEEIKFYKEINPYFYAQLVYHGTIFNIHTCITPGTDKYRIEYLENELRKIDDFFYHNRDFYTYFRTGNFFSYYLNPFSLITVKYS